VICNIGYSAAARCFEKVLDENKYETLVKAIAARKKGLMP
jgi:NTE family protein